MFNSEDLVILQYIITYYELLLLNRLIIKTAGSESIVRFINLMK